MVDFISGWLGSAPGFMFPLLFASVGLIICEKVGVLNLGAEGVMSVSAMAGAFCVINGFSMTFAIFFGVLTAVLIGIPFAIAVVIFRAPQIPVGLSIVAIGLGTSQALGKEVAHKTFQTIGDLKFPVLTDIPIVGQFLFGQNLVIYLGVAFIIFLLSFIRYSHLGLNIRAVGEDPAAADASGIDVQVYQFICLIFGFALIGVAGAYLSVIASQLWTEGMVNGRGWIAVALVVFAQWSISRAIFGALIFGAADSLVPRLQAIGIDVPVYLLSMIPHLLTIAVLVSVAIFFRGRSGEPMGLGKIYLRQSR